MILKKNLLFHLVFIGMLVVGSICTAAPVMIDKNLFAQDRKPPPPESAAAPATPGKAAMQLNNIQLDGVIIQGDTRRALVRLKAPPVGPDRKRQSPFMTVRENQQVGDFRVIKIEPKSISVEKEGQNFVISLFAEGKVVIPAAVQPAPAPAPAPVPGGPDASGAVAHPDGAPVPQQAGRVQRGIPPQGVPGQQGMPVPGQQVMPVPGQPGADPSIAQQVPAAPDDAGAPPEEDDDEDE